MKEDRVYLQHIRDAVIKIFEYTQDGEDTFFEDNKSQDAVIRNLEIIGEAVNLLCGISLLVDERAVDVGKGKKL